MLECPHAVQSKSFDTAFGERLSLRLSVNAFCQDMLTKVHEASALFISPAVSSQAAESDPSLYRLAL